MQTTESKQHEGLADARESATTPAGTGAAHDEHGVPSIVLDSERKLGRGPILGLLVLAVLLGAAILIGMRTRAHAEKELSTETTQDADTPA